MSDNIDLELYNAASDGFLVSQLINKGATVDWRDKEYDYTALHRAAEYGMDTPLRSPASWTLAGV